MNKVLKIHDIKKYCIINELNEDAMNILIDSLFGWSDLDSLYKKIDNLKFVENYQTHKWNYIDFILEFNLNFSQGCIVKYISGFNEISALDLEKIKFHSCCVKNKNSNHYKEYSKYKF